VSTLRRLTISIVVVLGIGALAAAPAMATTRSAPGFICKVLHKALLGTKIAAQATAGEPWISQEGVPAVARFIGGKIHGGCTYRSTKTTLSANPVPVWDARLYLDDHFGHVRFDVEHSCISSWTRLTKASTGADYSCARFTGFEIPEPNEESVWSYFGRGAWEGQLYLYGETHSLSIGLMRSVLKKLTSQLSVG
jgi:hypothetical protein